MYGMMEENYSQFFEEDEENLGFNYV